ncbi:TrmH family RNA methyltransferase [Bauldia litoralis]|uniref:RNA methyltransferase, TrmH family n=1 Tax=Bauldia litoralis TaxID=665467 RepID=A0A1G6EG84_9HYPH|nr:RNA methyltransferase [Bauldia litoralis]SDB56441.1 RNA methyltransferase, TrmH family [Bauldia litoralis]
MADNRPTPRAPGKVLHITSLANPVVKEIRGLSLGKNRKASGQFIAEGLKLVAEAVKAGWTIRRLVHATRVTDDPLVAQLAATTRTRGGDVVVVSEAVLGKMTRRENPQTVLGVFDQQLTDASAIRPGPASVWVALEQVRDPGNLGTILRTVDSVGAEGVILVGDTVDPFSMEAVRATMGSIFNVALARMTSEAFAKLIAAWPGTSVGTHLAGAVDYRTVDYKGPVLLVMGAEQAGLTPALAEACGRLVKIPMAGKADSLNLAVATGVMLFEIRRGALSIDA